MPYASSLTDAEWEVLEPLLVEILPPKKRTRPSNWTKRNLIDGIFYQLKNGCNWEDLPKDLPPYSTVYWHYKQWREAGAIEQLMNVLHEQVREQCSSVVTFTVSQKRPCTRAEPPFSPSFVSQSAQNLTRLCVF